MYIYTSIEFCFLIFRSHPQFSSDFRNVRLALASDGFSPYGSTAVPFRAQITTAHWCVMENCIEAQWYLNIHRGQFIDLAPNGTEDERIASSIDHFPKWVNIQP